MRLRRNRKGETALPDMPGVLGTGLVYNRQFWAGVFGRENAIHMEIGVGKGDFILAAAERFPDIDFVGIERSPTILFAAAKKNRKRPLPNLRLLPVDADELEAFFFPEQIGRIYLNFSDPWPKTRHEDRRLTAKDKLAMYRRLLAPEGQIHFKTDQHKFFAYTIKGLIREGWSVGKITDDLYRSGFEGNIATEYEKRFIEAGRPIYRLEAWRSRI